MAAPWEPSRAWSAHLLHTHLPARSGGRAEVPRARGGAAGGVGGAAAGGVGGAAAGVGGAAAVGGAAG